MTPALRHITERTVEGEHPSTSRSLPGPTAFIGIATLALFTCS